VSARSPIVAHLKGLGIPVTRASVLFALYGNTPPDEWSVEHEEHLPEEVRDWSLFAWQDDELTYIGPPIKS